MVSIKARLGALTAALALVGAGLVGGQAAAQGTGPYRTHTYVDKPAGITVQVPDGWPGRRVPDWAGATWHNPAYPAETLTIAVSGCCSCLSTDAVGGAVTEKSMEGPLGVVRVLSFHVKAGVGTMAYTSNMVWSTGDKPPTGYLAYDVVASSVGTVGTGTFMCGDAGVQVVVPKADQALARYIIRTAKVAWSRTPTQPPSTHSTQAAPKAAAPAEQAVTLSVHVLKTPSPAAYPGKYLHLSYPHSVTVVVPIGYVGLVTAYGVAGYVLVVPKGWAGGGALGEDGSGAVTLHAGNDAIIPGTLMVYETGGCQGCAELAAESYFPADRSRLAADMNLPADPLRPGLHEVFERPNLVYYSAPNTRAGLQVNGIVYSPLVGNLGKFFDPAFEQVEVALPAHDHALATVMLNAFLTMYVNAKTK